MAIYGIPWTASSHNSIIIQLNVFTSLQGPSVVNFPKFVPVISEPLRLIVHIHDSKPTIKIATLRTLHSWSTSMVAITNGYLRSIFQYKQCTSEGEICSDSDILHFYLSDYLSLQFLSFYFCFTDFISVSILGHVSIGQYSFDYNEWIHW